MAAGYKTGGRQAGTPNKVTATMREKLSSTLQNEIERLPEVLDSLTDIERLQVLVKLLSYVMPKAECNCEDVHKTISVNRMPSWVRDNSGLTAQIVTDSYRAVNEDGEEVSRYWDANGKEVRIIK